MERPYRERYQGFTVKHLHEHLVKDHGFGWGYTWLKLHLQWKGVVAKAPRKGRTGASASAVRWPGMMLHQDGSRHAWLEGQPALDLIVTLDDATGAIYSAFLVEEEGTASTFKVLKEVFSAHGLSMSLYTDRGGHYFHTSKAGEIDRRPSHATSLNEVHLLLLAARLCLQRVEAVRSWRPPGKPGAVQGFRSAFGRFLRHSFRSVAKANGNAR